MAMGLIGRKLARYLSAPRHVHGPSSPTPRELLSATLRPGDVLLVEGTSRISAAIKYLTTSSWSHAALFVGVIGEAHRVDRSHVFVEADLVDGVRSIGFDEFDGYATRICQPVGLDDAERRAVCEHALARLGQRYDLKNIIDLARYLIAEPPMPKSFRRRMLSLGSGDPTRAICSTMIAEAFQSIRYPILPTKETRAAARHDCPGCTEEIWHVRHHSLFAPRDFDMSPYFDVVKPTIFAGFDHRAMTWSTPNADRSPPASMSR